MVKIINHNTMFLKRRALPVRQSDNSTAELVKDLMDTLSANRENCVGMAANMISVNKAAIIVADGPYQIVMLNPRIIRKEGEYDAEEGCLSLKGVRPCTRYKKIEVEYDTPGWEHKTETFEDFVAQIIQHECDHLMGILI